MSCVFLYLVLHLMSLQVGQFVLGPVLQLVVSYERDHPRLLVLEPTAMDVHSNLVLPRKKHLHKGGKIRP